MSNYDITDHASDLHLLEDAQPNISFDSGEYFMDESIAMADWSGSRCVNPEDYEFEIIELYQGDQLVKVSKFDVESLAKHFGLI